MLFQLDMQLVKVNSEVTSLRGSEVSFRVNRDVWVVALDSEVLFLGLVDTFGLSIAFGMISQGEV